MYLKVIVVGVADTVHQIIRWILEGIQKRVLGGYDTHPVGTISEARLIQHHIPQPQVLAEGGGIIEHAVHGGGL